MYFLFFLGGGENRRRGVSAAAQIGARQICFRRRRRTFLALFRLALGAARENSKIKLSKFNKFISFYKNKAVVLLAGQICKVGIKLSRSEAYTTLIQ
jgi:hypothetical protein